MFQINRNSLLLASAIVLSGFQVWAQAPTSAANADSHLEVAVNYSAARANTVPGNFFWMQGGSVELGGAVSRHWAVMADVSGLHSALMPHAGAGIDLITAVFGPRYSIAPRNGGFAVYGRAMGGVTNGINSIFPNASGATTTASGVSLLVGGGMDRRLNRRVAYRMIDAAWLRTQLSNGTTTVQNDLRLSSGIAFRF